MNRFAVLFMPLAAAALAQSSAIVFNVDGASLVHWTAGRLLTVGPDGLLNWDRLPGMAEFRTHSKDRMVVGSNPLNTSHAYGVKVRLGSYGTDGDKPLTALSGKPLSIMEEARAAGKSIGLINTADLTEGGTGVYLGKYGFAGEPERYSDEMIRRQRCAVAMQMVEARPDIMLGGGEQYFLRTDEQGVHGKVGLCGEHSALERARALGFDIRFRENEGVDAAGARPILGLYAAMTMSPSDGFDPKKGPALAAMVDLALRVLSKNPKGFLLVVNEEGVDDCSNRLEAPCAFAAIGEADAAIGRMNEFVESHPQTLLLVVADSPAAGISLLNRLSTSTTSIEAGVKLPERDPDGAPLHGAGGMGTAPFLSKPDEAGRRHAFAVAWATRSDVTGGVLARAAGNNSNLVRGSMDNTKVYRLVYRTLFGRDVP
jgi:alkaline phosphatase